MKALVVATSVGMMWGSLMAPAIAEPQGRVTFTVPASCNTTTPSGRRPMQIRSLSYSLDYRDPAYSVHSFTSNGKTITWTSSMTPGVYLYDLNAWGDRVSGDVSKGFCSSGDVELVVLPGDSIQVAINPRFSSGVLDDVFRPMVVYGVASPDLDLRLLGLSGSPSCGARVSSLESVAISIERDSVGYWSVDAGAKNPADKPVFAVGVREGSRTWYFRLVSNDPATSYHGKPGSARFDVTPERVRAALAARADTLLCL